MTKACWSEVGEAPQQADGDAGCGGLGLLRCGLLSKRALRMVAGFQEEGTESRQGTQDSSRLLPSQCACPGAVTGQEMCVS